MIIAARFNGPPDSGNGGYSAGLLAAYVGPGAATVTLRRPPPLDVELAVRPATRGVAAYQGERLIADAVPADAPDSTVAPVSLAEARAASEHYPGFVDHPFPTCYVCGPDREDGLRIFAAPLAVGRTAGVFRVPDDVAPEIVWAALDCPGGWAIAAPGRPYVLGRMTANVIALPEPGAECVVVGQGTGTEGRKGYVRSTVFDPDGAVLASAVATWLAI